jgi:hypothetical protein
MRDRQRSTSTAAIAATTVATAITQNTMRLAVVSVSPKVVVAPGES